MADRWSRIVERNWPAKIMSVVAAVILFLFYQATSLEERFFTVPLKVQVNESYTASSDVPSSAKVTLRGSEDNVFMILEEDIEVYADFTEHSAEGIFREPVKFRKRGSAEGVEPLEIRLEPQMITMEIQKKVSRPVRIQPVLKGYPVKGYELEQYFLSSEEIMVEGPRSHVEGLDAVKTEDIVLDGREGDFYIRAKFDVKDPYLSFPSGDSVGFQGIIKETRILKTFENVGIVYMDLSPVLEIVSPPDGGAIKVQGTQLELENTSIANFSLIADCSAIKVPGKYRIRTSAFVPQGLNVLKYEPEFIEMEVVRKNTE